MRMPGSKTQTIWLPLVLIMILALRSLEAKDKGKPNSLWTTCTIIYIVIKNSRTKHFTKIWEYFHITGNSYTFVSRTSTCRHIDGYEVPYRCTGGSGGKVCEQECSKWAACIGYGVLRNTDKCILYPSFATPCPEGWSEGKGPVATAVLDLRDGGSSGYCKFKQG